MKKILIFQVLLLSFFSLNAQSFLESNGKKIHKELNKWSESFNDLEFIKEIEKREYYSINLKDGKTGNILVLSSAKGRFDHFDIMTIICSGKIEFIKVIKYRSEYGAEITNKKWLSQFYQKDTKEFVFRKDIDAVSGATFSANGLINEINAILKDIESFN